MAHPTDSWTWTTVACDDESDKRITVWCDDGRPASNTPRQCGLHGSNRLMVQDRGFLDITALAVEPTLLLDFNGVRMSISPHDLKPVARTARRVQFCLRVLDGATFTITLEHTLVSNVEPGPSPSSPKFCILGRFKPFPTISPQDARLLDAMISQNFVPYQNPHELRGKTNEQIARLGRRLFPWTSHSYALAMATNDWTTASFARIVLLQTFRYTSLPGQPLDKASLARMIWESDWGNFVPSNATFMNAFMMSPAPSLDSITRQLEAVSSDLLRLAEAESRLLSAALASLPRTCTGRHTRLYSGQPDIMQMGFERFVVEMYECPANEGPVGEPLCISDFERCLETFMAPANSIFTTKCPWSFTDVKQDALSYANGILLILHPSPVVSDPVCEDAAVALWDGCAYVTSLSDGEDKREYVFPAQSRFRVLEIERNPDTLKARYVIHLEAQPSTDLKVGPSKERWRGSMDTLASEKKGYTKEESTPVEDEDSSWLSRWCCLQ